MSPRPRVIRDEPIEPKWQCGTCKRVVTGEPGVATKDPKFRIGKCPECQYLNAMFLRVK